MTPEEIKKEKARQRAAAWRKANPERYKAAVEKCKAAKPEKYRALAEAWRAKNATRMRAKWKEYRTANRERMHEYVRKWIAKHPERRKQIANNWRKNNKAYVNAVYAKRRAAKLNATPAWANQFFMQEAYELARLRTEMTGIEWHVDHIVPLVSPIVCGLHVEHNLSVVPAFENQSKNNRRWPDMP